jgi:hypothetical protein
MYRMSSKIIGEFVEVEHGLSFSYALCDPEKDQFFIEKGYPHIIDMIGGIRYGLVKKTVIYIVVDENEEGLVVEKWNIKKHIIYNKG